MSHFRFIRDALNAPLSQNTALCLIVAGGDRWHNFAGSEICLRTFSALNGNEGKQQELRYKNTGQLNPPTNTMNSECKDKGNQCEAGFSAAKKN